MKNMHFSPLRPLAFAIALFCSTGLAHAQYGWTDDRGRKQYSDMPPPASVPAHRIFKQPGGPSGEAPPGPAAAPAAAAPKETPQAAQPTLAEREAEFRKRRAEQAEKEKKAAEEAQRVADNKRRCEQARDYQRTLEAGERIVRRDKNGERVFLTDEERARDLRDAKRALQDCK